MMKRHPTNQVHTGPRRIASALILGLICLATLASSEALAMPSVYHSPNDDGQAPGGPPVLATGVQTLHLYIDGGSQVSASLPCEAGDGDEVCAWEVTITPTGDISFLGFVDGLGVESNFSISSLRAIGGDPYAGDVGPTKMGDLTIDSTISGTVELESGSAVGAAQSLSSLTPTEIVSVPEPALTWLLISGVLGLRTLVAWRQRRH
jgi:hypothetical protein